MSDEINTTRRFVSMVAFCTVVGITAGIVLPSALAFIALAFIGAFGGGLAFGWITADETITEGESDE